MGGKLAKNIIRSVFRSSQNRHSIDQNCLGAGRCPYGLTRAGTWMNEAGRVDRVDMRHSPHATGTRRVSVVAARPHPT